MRSIFCVLLSAGAFIGSTYPGCAVTTGVYVEKQYNTDPSVFTQPDLNAKAKVEATFGGKQ